MRFGLLKMFRVFPSSVKVKRRIKFLSYLGIIEDAIHSAKQWPFKKDEDGFRRIQIYLKNLYLLHRWFCEIPLNNQPGLDKFIMLNIKLNLFCFAGFLTISFWSLQALK